MANINDAFPSKYLKASDLKGGQPVVVVDHVAFEPVGRNREMKGVVYFRGKDKGLVLNRTNANKLTQLAGTSETDDWAGLWLEVRRVVEFWIDHGVRIFRVDNPHTKPFRFWHWLIAGIHETRPDVIFLAEAFTRPKVQQSLAKFGFSQSYTYFTWRNTKAELEEYLTELTTTEAYEYLRPNFFANTPDILHAYLQEGGRPAFEARLVLAATLSPTYGIYSGFELCENRSAGPKSEEYLDSEKYQIRQWDWDRPGNIKALVRSVNRIRREHPALQWNGSLRFCVTDNPEIIAYLKTARDGSDPVLVIVNLDPHHMQHGHVEVPIDRVGLGPGDAYAAHDLVTDTPFAWTGARNYVRLDPGIRQAHILRLDVAPGSNRGVRL